MLPTDFVLYLQAQVNGKKIPSQLLRSGPSNPAKQVCPHKAEKTQINE